MQAKLTAVMETFTKVAVQKICKVFSYCFALNPAQLQGFNSYHDDVIHVKELVNEHEKKPERTNSQAVRDVPGEISCIYFNVICKNIQYTVILTVVILFSSDSGAVAPSVSLERMKPLTVLPEETLQPQDSVKGQEVSSLLK